MKEEEAKKLLQKYRDGKCTSFEMAQIEAWYISFGENEPGLSPKELQSMGNEIFEQLPGITNHQHSFRPNLKYIGIAACLFFSLGTWVYLGIIRDKIQQNQNAIVIHPGGSHAVLKLSSGNSIVLDSKQTGIKVDAKEITYNNGVEVLNSNLRNTIDTATETITTPKGGEYQITLADGTKVWLNAATSLRFPRTFAGAANRRVVLNGEAYFEVTKDAEHPFIVTSRFQNLHVLGTHFNVSAYNDEQAVKSTLLEGSIIINDRTLLKPGYQATNSNSNIQIEQVDTDNAIAWKNGEFMFRKEPLETIMRKIARWYNVDVEFEDQGLAKKLFGGEISRFTDVKTVLNTLQLTGQVNFKIEGRRIMVLNR